MDAVPIRERTALLAALGMAGWPLACAASAVQIASSLLPACLALATAALVSHVVGADGTVGTDAAAVFSVLGLYTAAIVAGHAAEAVYAPLQFAVKSRIDGERRAQISRLAATGDTVEPLERPAVQELIRLAKADPENWTERTVGDGALAQLAMLASLLGLTASCAVLATFRWWLIPALALPALLVRMHQTRQGAEFFQQWRRGIREGMRANVWARMLVGPAEGKEVRIFGFSATAAERMKGHHLAMFEPVWAVGERNLWRQGNRLVLTTGGLGLVYAVAVLAVARGQTTVAVESAVFAAGWSAYQALTGYDGRAVLGALPGVRAYAELERILAAAPGEGSGARTPPGAGPPTGSPRVRLQGICFGYRGTDRLVLDRLDLDVRPGELLALVGLNGAGKSTLIKILAGLYRPTAGRITVDGVDLADVGIGAWRRQIAVVFQDFARYHLSLADNITLGQATVPPDAAALETAVRDAGMADLVATLPAGLDTPLSRARRGGIDLSGGQWQQVVLARALYAARVGARLLVLDEPTAHLDVRTEFEIFDRLARRRGDVGVVLISHRLSTVRQADRIALLDAGRITECGSHEQLMELGGGYAEMFTIQAQRFAAGHDDVAGEPELFTPGDVEGVPR